jgi:hypothetical protein
MSDTDSNATERPTKPGEDTLSDEDKDQLEQERKERLDPENRPENAEVDNTAREFDQETGEFEKRGDEVENGPVIGADRPDGVEGHTVED